LRQKEVMHQDCSVSPAAAPRPRLFFDRLTETDCSTRLRFAPPLPSFPSPLPFFFFRIRRQPHKSTELHDAWSLPIPSGIWIWVLLPPFHSLPLAPLYSSSFFTRTPSSLTFSPSPLLAVGPLLGRPDVAMALFRSAFSPSSFHR